jgi:hypothetical protein
MQRRGWRDERILGFPGENWLVFLADVWAT